VPLLRQIRATDFIKAPFYVGRYTARYHYCQSITAKSQNRNQTNSIDMTLKLKKLSAEDENLYLHRNNQPLACPYAAGGSVTQMVYPETNLTLGGQQPLPISDQQPRRITCGTWCALFRVYDNGENRNNTCIQGCGSMLPKEPVKVEQ
jgi:hypothetical protein